MTETILAVDDDIDILELVQMSLTAKDSMLLRQTTE